MLRGYLVVFCFWGYFSHFLRFQGCIRLFQVLGVFWTFFVFTGAFWSFFFNLWGYFGRIQVIEGILVFFRHGGYFGYFRCFGVRWSIFRFWGIFLSFSRFRGCIGLFLGIWCVQDIFLCLRGHFGYFLRFMGVFQSYSSNRGYFDLFQAGGVLCSFSMLQGYFSQFLGFWGLFRLVFRF